MEQPDIIQINSRTYRKYPVRLQSGQNLILSSQKIDLLELDDGEGSDEGIEVNLDAMQDEYQERQTSAPIVSNRPINITQIYYDPDMNSFSLFTTLPEQRVFNNIFGYRATDRTEVQKKIENETHCILNPNKTKMAVEIRASDPYFVLKGHEMLMDEMKKPYDSRPTEYHVINQSSREFLETLYPEEKSTQMAFDFQVPEFRPEVQKGDLEEYPQISIQNTQGKFQYTLYNYPNQLQRFLLTDGGSKIKSLNNNKNTKFYVDKDQKVMTIKSKTEQGVKEGYASLIRLINEDGLLAAGLKETFTSANFTHFLAVDLRNNQRLTSSSEEILSSIRNLNQVFRQHPQQFHITLGMVSVADQEQFIAAFTQLEQEIQQISEGQPIKLFVSKFDVFGKPDAARTL